MTAESRRPVRAVDRHDDAVFEALADATRRRLLLAVLVDRHRRDSAVPLDALVGDGATRTELHHVHLPKLREDGFLDWVPGADHVDPGPRFPEVRVVLERLGYPAAGREDGSSVPTRRPRSPPVVGYGECDVCGAYGVALYERPGGDPDRGALEVCTICRER